VTAALDSNAERLLRDLAPQVLGAVVRRFRDFAACEDAVQEALIAAAAQWPRDGIPDNPRGWLIQVALRRMTDHLRSETSRRSREAAVAGEAPAAVAPYLTMRAARLAEQAPRGSADAPRRALGFPRGA